MSGKKSFDGNIPVLFAEGKSLAEAWENSMIELYEKGGEARTQYDKKEDRLSKDSSMMVVCLDPMSEPFLHRAFPGGLEDLEEYRQEVMYGIKNHWVRNPTDPTNTKWEYTYHQRLTEYTVPLDLVMQFNTGLPPLAKEFMKKNNMGILLDQPWVKIEDRRVDKYGFDEKGKIKIDEDSEKVVVINQLEACVEKLAEVPYSRRIQAVTWKPWEDLVAYDPACLQSLWLRALPGDDGKLRLNMNVRFRSRDSYDAAFMNMVAFVDLMEDLAKQVSERRGEEVLVGRYADFSDSYHIYGRRLDHFEQGFLKLLKERSFEDRTWTREFAEPIFEEARPMIRKKIEEKDKRDKEG